MALAAEVILNRVSTTLLDDSAAIDAERRWPSETELLDYLCAGQVQVVVLKPDANTKVDWLTLDDTVSRQSLPADGIVPLQVIQNAATGTQTGRAIQLMDRQDLDAMDPLWPTRTGTDVEGWVYDDRDSKGFLVYPRATGDVYVVYSAVPDRVQAKTDPISLSDTYENALYHWVLAHAYAKNAKRGDVAKFNLHMQMFRSALGLKAEAERSVAPIPSERTKTQTGGV